MNIRDIFKYIFSNAIAAEKFTPYLPNLGWDEYELAHKSNPVINRLVKMRRANINANGWTIHCTLFNQESRNKRVADQIYSSLKNDINIDTIIADIVSVTSIFGSAYSIVNAENKPIIQNPKFFNLYYDSINKRARKIKLKIDGKEAKEFTENKDIFIFRDSDTTFKPLGDSPIDSCYEWYLLYQHAVQSNNNMISRGNVGTVIALFEKEMQAYLDTVVDEKTQKKNWQIWAEQFKQLFGGSKNSNKIGVGIGIKEFIDLAKNNKDIQLVDLINKAESAMYQSFGFTKTGENSTYNNAQTFSYEQYDSVGRAYEAQIAHYINNFLLPYFGIETSNKLYFGFEKQADPDEIKNKTLYITAFEKLIGVSDNLQYKMKITNMLLDKLDVDPIDEAMLEQSTPAPAELPIINGNVLDVESTEKEVVELKEQFKQKKKTPIEKALTSTDYNNPRNGKGFYNQWIKSIKKQIETYSDELKGKTEVEAKKIKLPKIETFYSIPALKKDLLKFADFALDKETFTRKLSEYPAYILAFIDNRAESILKGNTDGFAGVDEETSSQILTIFNANIAAGVDAVREAINQKIDGISANRAKVIAETEVASAVEGTRFLTFENEGYKYKRVLNVGDTKVSDFCLEADFAGVVEIDHQYKSAWGKSKMLPLHPSERSTMIFGLKKEEIE